MQHNFKHVVHLMLENRGFDTLLGWLYADGAKPAVNIPALRNAEARDDERKPRRRDQAFQHAVASDSVPAFTYLEPTFFSQASPTIGTDYHPPGSLYEGEKFLRRR